MALVRPASLSFGKYLGGISSMLPQPRALAFLMNSSISQWGSKHQWTIDCLIRPLRMGDMEAASVDWGEPTNPSAAAPATPLSRSRRLVPSDGFGRELSNVFMRGGDPSKESTRRRVGEGPRAPRVF